MSLVEAESLRERYSVLRYAKEKGLIEDIARKIADEFYA